MKVPSKMTALLCIALTACATSESPTIASQPLASAEIAEVDLLSSVNAKETSLSGESLERLSEAGTLIRNADSEFIESPYNASAAAGGLLTSRGYVLTVVDERFAVNATTLLNSAEKEIRDAVSFLSDNDEKVAVIEGHTDNTGSYAFNVRQSRGKAIAVRDALVEAGVDSERLSIREVGGADPIADNETVDGRRSNRRVDIVFITQDD